MGVVQLELDGLFREVVGGKVVYTDYVEGAKVETKQHMAGGRCRQCNYVESSDGMHGAHCGNCECCKE